MLILRIFVGLVVAVSVTAASATAQTLATHSFSAGWATFGLSLPPRSAWEGVRVGGFETQTDVKTTWPDGSIRFAIVTAYIESDGAHPVARAAAAGGTFTPRWPAVTVTFTTGGETYNATLPPFDGSNSWLSNGALVRESRVIVSPHARSPHPLLQVLFDVRSYASGDHRVDVTVQNVKDVPEGGAVGYDVSVTVDGSVLYTKALVQQAYLTRWRKTFSTAGLRLATVTPDFEPFFTAGAIPRFAASVVNHNYGTPGADILSFGDMTPNMPSAGGRPEIGFYPYWTAQYIVHRTQTTLNYMLTHGDLSGSWSGHITEPDGLSQVTLERYPDYWLDARSIGRPNGPHTLNGTTEWIENAHMPSLTYVPYLVTGDRYYLDQLKFWASFAMLSTWPLDPDVPRTGQGLLYHNQVRGIAWTLRALGDCVSATPDTDPEKGYFQTRLQANLDWFDTWARTIDGGATEAIFLGKFGTDTGGWTPPFKVRIAPWMNAYVAWALHHLGELGFSPVEALRDRILRFHVRMFNDPGYDRPYAGPYFLNISTVSSDGQRFHTMSEAFCETFGCPPGPNTLTPLPGYYGPEERAMLILAAQQGIPDASAALAWLESQPGVVEDVNARSGFAIVAGGARPSRGTSAPRPSRPAARPPDVRPIR